MIAKLHDKMGVQVKLVDVPAPPRAIVEYKSHYFVLTSSGGAIAHYHEVEVHHVDG